MHRDFKVLQVFFFKSLNGKEPVRDWLLSFSDENRKIIGIDIKKVEFGWPLGMPLCRPLGKGLYEVRSHLNDKTISRVIFCIEDSMMILLNGFIKKTQKTPSQEIELALKRREEMYE